MGKDGLVRFGVAMERSLLAEIDALVDERGVTRSEVLRDLVRAEVARAKTRESVPAVATLTLVYDHHVRELTEKLTEAQHALGEQVRATVHVHLDHDRCLEVIILRGLSHNLRQVGERLLATRGVEQGGLHVVPEANTRAHAHAHGEHTAKRTSKRASAPTRERSARAKTTSPLAGRSRGHTH